MREANNLDDVVSARLRAVLAATDHGVPDQQPPAPAIPQPPVTGPGGPPFPADDFRDMSPLNWSDIVPSWPDDLDLAAGDPAPAGAVVASPPGTAASPPAAEVEQVTARSRPAAATTSTPEAAHEPPAPVAALAGPHAPAGLESESFVLEALREHAPSAARVPAAPAPQGSVALSAAGAFDSGRRGGRLVAFDPGRRGVKALAAVAIVVVVVAAVLAWRARPRVDPVVVPPVAAQAGSVSTDEPVGAAGGGPAAAGPGPSGGPEVVVAVGGKVRKPGLVHLRPGARVADALQAAGGADPGIDVALLNLARKVVDGELILVGVAPPPGAPAGTGPAGGGAAPAGGPINLNTATLADLDRLPGVGPVLAQRILDARTAQGSFRAVSDLRKVDGIGDARYQQLKDLVVV